MTSTLHIIAILLSFSNCCVTEEKSHLHIHLGYMYCEALTRGNSKNNLGDCIKMRHILHGWYMCSQFKMYQNMKLTWIVQKWDVTWPWKKSWKNEKLPPYILTMTQSLLWLQNVCTNTEWKILDEYTQMKMKLALDLNYYLENYIFTDSSCEYSTLYTRFSFSFWNHTFMDSCYWWKPNTKITFTYNSSIQGEALYLI